MERKIERKEGRKKEDNTAKHAKERISNRMAERKMFQEITIKKKECKRDNRENEMKEIKERRRRERQFG